MPANIEESERFDRRSALKKAAAAGAAAGLVWSAPKIEGLTLRPNYAAAASSASAFANFTGTLGSTAISADFPTCGDHKFTLQYTPGTGFTKPLISIVGAVNTSPPGAQIFSDAAVVAPSTLFGSLAPAPTASTSYSIAGEIDYQGAFNFQIPYCCT